MNFLDEALLTSQYVNMKGVFFTDETGLKIFVFINVMIFTFATFVKKT